MTKTFWLSFASQDAEPPFLGVAIISVTAGEALAALAEIDARFPHHAPGAEWIAAAVLKAHRLGCNPGGDVATFEINPDDPDLQLPHNRLLSKHELEDWGKHHPKF